MGRGSSKVGGGGGGSLSSRIANAGTLQQAMKIAEKNGIHLDSGVLKDVADEKLIKDGLAEIAWMKDEFPILKGENIKIISDPNYKGAYMYSKAGEGTIAYAGFSPTNTKQNSGAYYISANLTDRNGFTDSPQGTTLKHVTTHEMTHQLVRATCNEMVKRQTNGKLTSGNKSIHDAYSEYIVKTAYNSIPKKERGRKSLAGMKKQISKYAHSGGNGETLAEAMADYRANGPKAKPLSKAIYNTLKTETTSSGISKLVGK